MVTAVEATVGRVGATARQTDAVVGAVEVTVTPFDAVLASVEAMVGPFENMVAPVENMVAPVEIEERIEQPTDQTEPDLPWIVIVWNDPINLMSYVTWVFQKLFGYSLEKATSLMLDVHHKGRAVVSSGTRERAELDVFRLHEHGLWATMQQD